jgi:hypothetical protein
MSASLFSERGDKRPTGRAPQNGMPCAAMRQKKIIRQLIMRHSSFTKRDKPMQPNGCLRLAKEAPDHAQVRSGEGTGDVKRQSRPSGFGITAIRLGADPASAFARIGISACWASTCGYILAADGPRWCCPASKVGCGGCLLGPSMTCHPPLPAALRGRN